MKVENFIEILHKKENELTSAKELINQPFPKEKELTKKTKRLEEVNKILTGKDKEQDIDLEDKIDEKKSNKTKENDMEL